MSGHFAAVQVPAAPLRPNVASTKLLLPYLTFIDGPAPSAAASQRATRVAFSFRLSLSLSLAAIPDLLSVLLALYSACLPAWLLLFLLITNVTSYIPSQLTRIFNSNTCALALILQIRHSQLRLARNGIAQIAAVSSPNPRSGRARGLNRTRRAPREKVSCATDGKQNYYLPRTAPVQSLFFCAF